MKLIKIAREQAPAREDFVFSDKTVQGATVGKCGTSLYIISPRRFKLYTDGTDTVHILSGAGHFKWARGETPFAAGESFSAENVGEYEVNGNCEFAVVRTL